MRIVLHYLAAVAVLTVYGGQVCPFLEALSPLTLGMSTLAAFGIVYVFRRGFERLYVLSVPDLKQPLRQFQMEVLLGIVAGAMVMGYNERMFDFPLASGITLLAGFAAFSFFLGLDMALARERELIADAGSRVDATPPRKLYPITRRFTFVAVVAIFFEMVILFLVISKDIRWLSEQHHISVMDVQRSVAAEIVFIMAVLLGVVVNLVFSYSRNLKILFDHQTAVLKNVAGGDLSGIVPVATQDEFGVIAGYTNVMIERLRHRISLMSALKVAQEVQQNLLPQKAPVVPGMDVSGLSRYCDETGGDYFDYYLLSGGRLAVVVGDASDHGVGSALYMATARAFLTAGVMDDGDPGDPGILMGRVNRFLVKDSAESGRFMTVFFAEFDTEARRIRWVRAGHDPAFFYDAGAGRFEMLTGKGLALGVDEGAAYSFRTREGWSDGSIVLIGTDGIWETRNAEDRLFGKRRLREVVRAHAHESAESIRDAVIDAVTGFRGDLPQQDDITLVVIKLVS